MTGLSPKTDGRWQLSEPSLICLRREGATCVRSLKDISGVPAYPYRKNELGAFRRRAQSKGHLEVARGPAWKGTFGIDYAEQCRCRRALLRLLVWSGVAIPFAIARDLCRGDEQAAWGESGGKGSRNGRYQESGSVPASLAPGGMVLSRAAYAGTCHSRISGNFLSVTVFHPKLQFFMIVLPWNLNSWSGSSFHGKCPAVPFFGARNDFSRIQTT